jgi:hypothetical protein
MKLQSLSGNIKLSWTNSIIVNNKFININKLLLSMLTLKMLLMLTVRIWSMFVLWIFLVSRVDLFFPIEVFFILLLRKLSGTLLMNKIFIKRPTSQINKINIFYGDIFLIPEQFLDKLFLLFQFRQHFTLVILSIGLYQVVE